MDQDVYRIEDESPRRGSVREHRRARRNRFAAIGLTLVALLLGVSAGLLWMSQGGWQRQVDLAPEVAADSAESALPETDLQADAGELDEIIHTDPQDDDLQAAIDGPEQTDEFLQRVGEGNATPVESTVELGGTIFDQGFVASGRPVGSATSEARIQELLAARGPTATPTPQPYIGRLDAVVALGGAELWDEESGVLLTRLPQGTHFFAQLRSPDEQWLLGSTADGQSGWVAVDQLIAFDTRRLAQGQTQVAPKTPTPVVEYILLPTATPQPVTAGGAPPVAQAIESPEIIDGPIARISLSDSRLNVRAGPGSNYPIVTKAHPDERFSVIGVASSGEWVRLAISDVTGGFGWVSIEFVEITGSLEELPTGDEINPAPPYTEGAEAERVRRARAGDGSTSHSSPHPAHPHLVYTGLVAPVQTEPTEMQPAAYAASPAPEGLTGKLAIQTAWGREIYLYEFATGDLRLLTTGFDPALSPDGTQVAFTRDGGEHGLYLINVDGTNERMIFNGRELLRSPSWSPDGGWIVFERADEFTDCRDVGRRCPSGKEPRPGYPAGIFRQPMLARVDVHGGNYRDLGVLQSARAPDWSHAGIVYSSAAGIQVTQDHPDAVTAEVYFQIQKQYEHSPALQPGGNMVLFHRREASHWEIYGVNLDGSGLRALTRPEFTLVRQLPANVAAVWSPDGRHIAFLSNRQPNHEAGPWAIWVMDADGGNQRPLPIELPLTYTYVEERMMSWSR